MSVNEKRLVLKDIVIESRASDNFVNATQLCKAGGKEFKHWISLESTKELITHLEQDFRSNTGCPVLNPLTLVDKKVGGNHSGTWIHPDLAVPLAQWISPAFAIQVSRWIRELFTTGTVTIDKEAEFKELESKFAKQCDEMKELEERMQRVLNMLVTFKKIKEEKEGIIYIVSTLNYAQQGLYKIGRTKNLKARNSAHNTTHPSGDKIKILAQYKVNDAHHIEATLHKKLAGLRPSDNSEFFMCPFDSLCDIIDLVVQQDDQCNDQVNRIIDTLYYLKQNRNSFHDWTAGLDLSLFQEHVTITDGKEEVARFDVTRATTEEKQERECLEAYKKTIEHPTQMREVQVLPRVHAAENGCAKEAIQSHRLGTRSAGGRRRQPVDHPMARFIKTRMRTNQ